MKNSLAIYGEENFSNNFVGDEDFYTGEHDEMVNFAGARSFANENRSGRTFVMTITSDVKEQRKVVLIPSYASKFKGKVVANDNSFVGEKDPQDPSIIYHISAVGSPSEIQELHAFLSHVPSNLIGMRISTTNPDQLQKIMTVEEHSPFSLEKSKELFLGTFIDEKSIKDNMITFATPDIVLGPETEVSLPIIEGTHTITFFVGAVLSTSSGLRKKTKEAVKNIAMYRRG